MGPGGSLLLLVAPGGSWGLLVSSGEVLEAPGAIGDALGLACSFGIRLHLESVLIPDQGLGYQTI